MTADAATLEVLASRFINTDSLPWIETTPGNKMKVIYHDPDHHRKTRAWRRHSGACA